MTALALILVLSVPGQEGDILQDAHMQFRQDFIEFLPENFDSVSTTSLMEDGAEIAEYVYSSYADDIRSLAQDRLKQLPDADPGFSDGFTLRDEVDLEALGFLEFILSGSVEHLDGYLYLLRFWDPATAAGYAKTIILSRNLPPSELAFRIMAERMAPDLYRLLTGDCERPVIVIHSLRDRFAVDLALQDSGCYLPVRLRWYQPAP